MPSANADERSYRALRIEDIVQAQQIFHSDLVERTNVVATAVGKYRRRRDEHDHGPKTLENTYVSAHAWPALMVFVRKWASQSEFHKLNHEHQLVPPYVSLPDRRRVPTCVILVEEQHALSTPLYRRFNLPTWLLGGGLPVVRRAQEEDRAGSLGCLVTDGANVFAITNRHVAGPPASAIDTLRNGERQTIGRTAEKQVTKLALDTAYPGFRTGQGWAAPVTFLNVDAGLIEVEDVHEWTAQVFGLGTLGELYDLSSDTISLDLIGTRVRAFGAASGSITGEIHAFFYRYKTVGAVGYVADLLIGPAADATLDTTPGDSGTLWCIEEGSAPRPIAMQWGGQTFAPAGRYRLALATSLSSILRTLDVDLIRDWNIGHNEYWGKVGHYKVAATACNIIDGPAQPIIQANAENIAYDDDRISEADVSPAKEDFVPLADVADIIWRSTRGKDKANHFADMDERGKGAFAGKTLLDLTKKEANIDPAKWVAFYEQLGTDGQHMGALPFRVWEMFDEAVADLRNNDVGAWVAAVGLMAHYVGDASQPLHVSYLHHGRTKEESRVHEVYESQMLDTYALDLVTKVNAAAPHIPKYPLAANGFEAAKLVIRLMRETVENLDPLTIVKTYTAQSGRSRKQVLWEETGDATAKCIARGARVLATLWDSAWVAGGGKQILESKIKKIPQSTLMKHYNDKTFCASDWLEQMVDTLTRPHTITSKRAPVTKKAAAHKASTGRKQPRA